MDVRGQHHTSAYFATQNVYSTHITEDWLGPQSTSVRFGK